MDDEIKNILTEQFKKLPSKLQEVILSSEFKDNIRNIGAKYQFNNEQINKLEDETVFILLGFKSINDYVQNIMKEVSITNSRAQSIYREINVIILNPIMRDLESFLKSQMKEENTVEVSKPIQTTIQTTQPIQKTEQDESANIETNEDLIRKALRENGRTISIKNIVAQLKEN